MAHFRIVGGVSAQDVLGTGQHLLLNCLDHASHDFMCAATFDRPAGARGSCGRHGGSSRSDQARLTPLREKVSHRTNQNHIIQCKALMITYAANWSRRQRLRNQVAAWLWPRASWLVTLPAPAAPAVHMRSISNSFYRVTNSVVAAQVVFGDLQHLLSAAPASLVVRNLGHT